MRGGAREFKDMSYEKWFSTAAGFAPRSWQKALGDDANCRDRLIRIPTGFGKTLGVLCAWLYHRVIQNDDAWPRRLVWTLPMRVLVEQTDQEARAVLERLGHLWDAASDHEGKVGVHVLMGGSDAAEWHLHPDQPAVLIGTQDMLLSRALNRGYGAARGRWPMDFGLVNQDCLWVLDEVQLMDVGLATSAQLQAFRDQDAARGLRPCKSWWMSATLQGRWLESPDTRVLVAGCPTLSIPKSERRGALWDDVQKPVERLPKPLDAKQWAKVTADRHRAQAQAGGRVTLAIANTVDRARDLFKALKSQKDLKSVELRLVHSRFRPAERATWRSEFLNRKACEQADRIIVATQVVEAGVDVSATCLLTEVAPWPSLVQRFGRAARYGGTAQVVVLPVEEKKAKPYDWAELTAAWDVLGLLDDVSPARLEQFEEDHPERLAELYPYAPAHLLLRHEVDELFDTTPDLTGADLDVSRFIRSGDERDVQVFWVDVDDDATAPERTIRPTREALCAVPFIAAREWLFGKGTRLAPNRRAWVWSYLEDRWLTPKKTDVYPGQVLLVTAATGGYDPELGWDAGAKGPVPVVSLSQAGPQEHADSAEEVEDLSAFGWKTIACHGQEAGQAALNLAVRLGVPERLRRLLELAGRWHDVGKAHPAFQGSIRHADRPQREDLAKAPSPAWRRPLYAFSDGTERRPGFRHELASTLALFAVLRRHRPDHPALLGPWRDVLEACGQPPDLEPAGSGSTPTRIEEEVLALNAPDFDLLAYLVCAHHGKVRARWYAAPDDQRGARGDQLPIRGVFERDTLPELTLCAADGSTAPLPASTLTLGPAEAGLSPRTGQSWIERVEGLLTQHGPFALAWLEALLRAADVSASRLTTSDSLLARRKVPV